MVEHKRKQKHPCLHCRNARWHKVPHYRGLEKPVFDRCTEDYSAPSQPQGCKGFTPVNTGTHAAINDSWDRAFGSN